VKEKFSANRGEALINQPGWLLSHTVQRSTAKNRQNRIETAPNPIMARCFCAPTSNPARLYLSVHRRGGRFSRKRARVPNKTSPNRGEDLPAKQAKAVTGGPPVLDLIEDDPAC
jgi:hypothetical protein